MATAIGVVDGGTEAEVVGSLGARDCVKVVVTIRSNLVRGLLVFEGVQIIDSESIEELAVHFLVGYFILVRGPHTVLQENKRRLLWRLFLAIGRTQKENKYGRGQDKILHQFDSLFYNL